jgi:hypothetical protein
MDCNYTDFNDEINFFYKNIINTNLIIGGIILVSTLTNMSLLCSMKTKINNISRMIIPPLYK